MDSISIESFCDEFEKIAVGDRAIARAVALAKTLPPTAKSRGRLQSLVRRAEARTMESGSWSDKPMGAGMRMAEMHDPDVARRYTPERLAKTKSIAESGKKARDALSAVAKSKHGSALSPALSMGGLAGLTAIEGAGAFNKKHSRKDRAKDAASAGFTGSILAAEAIHNKDMLRGAGKRVLGLIKKGEAEALEDLAEEYLEKISKMSRDMQDHANVDASRQAAQHAAPTPQRSGPRGVSMGHEHALHAGGPSLELARPKIQKLAPRAVGTAVKSAPKPGILQGALGIFKKAL